MSRLADTIRAIRKAVLFCSLTVCLIPFQYAYTLYLWLTRRSAKRQSPVVRLWYRGVAAILGLRVTWHIADRAALNTNALYVANHSSYLDIIALGGRLPPFFVAKADTADWPVFGFLITLGGTLFISRQRARLQQQMAMFGSALRNGKSLCLFPEGTTSDGCRILPFKSSLLHVLYETGMPDIAVLPVCLRYQTINGHAFSHANTDLVAWYGDMSLLPHLWALFQQKSIAVHVDILAPLRARHYTDAKSLTKQASTLIADVFAARSPTAPHNPAAQAPSNRHPDAA